MFVSLGIVAGMALSRSYLLREIKARSKSYRREFVKDYVMQQNLEKRKKGYSHHTNALIMPS